LSIKRHVISVIAGINRKSAVTLLYKSAAIFRLSATVLTGIVIITVVTSASGYPSDITVSKITKIYSITANNFFMLYIEFNYCIQITETDLAG
jgi:hypothetical protein